MEVAQNAIDALKAQLRGELLQEADTGYHEARSVWNAMIDRKPAIIVRCTGTADVIQAVEFARQHGVLLSVRSGGHNIAGNAICEGGLVIDLSLIRNVRVDPDTKRAWVGAGATLSQRQASNSAVTISRRRPALPGAIPHRQMPLFLEGK